MSNFILKFHSLFIVLTFCFSAKAQVNDAWLWLNLNVEKKITQKFSAQFTHSLRFYENFSELGTSFSELGTSYKIINPLTVGGFYRFSQNKKVDDFYSNRHLFSLYLNYKLKYNQFKINFREQIQTKYTDVGTSETGMAPSDHFRSKISVSYDLNKKYTPFISTELFYAIGGYIDNVRYKVGAEYVFNKISSVNLYYMIDKEIDVKNPWTNYIIGLEYNYTF